jgi:hypothetical protein
MKRPKLEEIYLVIEGEGICDQCKKEIKGEIIHFEKSGDFCRKCFNKAIKIIN